MSLSITPGIHVLDLCYWLIIQLVRACQCRLLVLWHRCFLMLLYIHSGSSSVPSVSLRRARRLPFARRYFTRSGQQRSVLRKVCSILFIGCFKRSTYTTNLGNSTKSRYLVLSFSVVSNRKFWFKVSLSSFKRLKLRYPNSLDFEKNFNFNSSYSNRGTGFPGT